MYQRYDAVIVGAGGAGLKAALHLATQRQARIAVISKLYPVRSRTGHMILQTLYQQCIKHDVHFYNEFHLLDLLVEQGRCAGVAALCLATGELYTFHSKAVVFATGGCGKFYRVTSNAHALTGDGMAVALRRGIPLEDMEFFQFHPTGIYKMGILLSEAARGEGGILRNRSGERFMERYAPTLLDLAPRDMVSRAMYREIEQGRGIEGKNWLHLDVTHLGREVLDKKLPDITDFVRTYMGIEPAKELIPVQPTAHYAMGGIPTDTEARVIIDEKNTPLPGFYAAGECACVSVHGANRLGTNSLVDILVFGRRAGRNAAKFVRENDWAPLPAKPDERAEVLLAQVMNASGKERAADIRDALQDGMMDKAGVFREAKGLAKMRETLKEIRDRYQRIQVEDRSRKYNTELVEVIELGGMIDLAETLVEGALARQESRGAHSREDFPKRDDPNWLKHTLAYHTPRGIDLRYKPVTITKFEPKERKY